MSVLEGLCSRGRRTGAGSGRPAAVEGAGPRRGCRTGWRGGYARGRWCQLREPRAGRVLSARRGCRGGGADAQGRLGAGWRKVVRGGAQRREQPCPSPAGGALSGVAEPPAGVVEGAGSDPGQAAASGCAPGQVQGRACADEASTPRGQNWRGWRT